MNVRKGPALEQNTQAASAAIDNGSIDLSRLVCDEMSNAMSGIVNPSPENSNETRSVAGMKLHLILKTLMENNKESARGAAKACKIPLSTFAGYLKPNKRQVDTLLLIKKVPLN